MTKMTKKVALSYALALLNETELPDVSKEEVIAKLTDMLASLDRKSPTGEKKMTEHQQENETFKGYIMTYLGNGEKKTAICPLCDADTVIPDDGRGYINKELLDEVNRFYKERIEPERFL